jgi:predicted metal-dependent HD superfamily phosphohydrolase
MAENQTLLLKDAQALVTDLLTNKISKNLRFHTLQHTQEVVAACEKIAEFQQLPQEERLILAVAAWFHDTGYTGGQAKDHESLSVQLATDFLKQHTANEEFTAKVIGCINATRMPQDPTNALEEIICDADLSHLGTDAFKEKSRLLREELEEFGGKEVSKKSWRKINIRFLDINTLLNMGKSYYNLGKKNTSPN